MAEMFRSFFGSGTGSARGAEFVGQYVELGQQKLKIKKVIAEGNFIKTLKGPMKLIEWVKIALLFS